MTHQQHPLSAAFPAMSAPDFQALKDSIECIGVQNAITLHEGMVIDGWHRYSASQELGMPCPERELPADVDPVDFVKAQNKERRHLSAGAWALIETELWQWRAVGKPASPNSAPGAEYQDAERNSAPGAELAAKSAADMAASAGVSVRSIEQAKNVSRKAAAEIKDAVKAGAVSLKDAAAVASLPQEEQVALAAEGPEAIKKAARTKAAKAALAAPPAPEAAPPMSGQADSAGGDDAQAEMLADYERLSADNQMMARVFEADDRLAAAMAEVARLTEENRVLTTRVNGLIGEKDAAVKMAKTYKRKLDALEKRTGTA
ncbi:hypothetical protein [Achromobacter xylosoxidans]|uniref:hypothetical protein n=1 Tax=Alcaligenes xylosoxydans xylosoxydans TaxID=85698 RepID=UPI001EEF3056|nr:hypothetical protein [Achromobacter xylosoxidans]